MPDAREAGVRSAIIRLAGSLMLAALLMMLCSPAEIDGLTYLVDLVLSSCFVLYPFFVLIAKLLRRTYSLMQAASDFPTILLTCFLILPSAREQSIFFIETLWNWLRVPSSDSSISEDLKYFHSAVFFTDLGGGECVDVILYSRLLDAAGAAGQVSTHFFGNDQFLRAKKVGSHFFSVVGCGVG